MAKASAKKLAYEKEYQKEHAVIKSIKFFKNTNKDILEHLQTVDEPFSAYVKRLIKEDMQKKKPE